MHYMSWLLTGFLATMTQLLFEVAAQQMRLTRMSLPFLLGTMYTEARSRAKLIGFANHIVNGLLFAAVYVGLFMYFGRACWWFGGLLGLAQAAIVLLVGMPLLQEIHPHMASERQGPTVRRQLEPPGFMALNYGPRTPLAIVVSHALFGVVFGSLYRM
jgi:uncharacterized membrane protein YagU involved in acid resistance